MTTPTPGNGPSSGPALPKLGPGELRARVAGVLASAPNRAWTVSAVTAVLNGRSAGAVGAACDRLVELGRARQLPGSPRRYQAAPTTPSTAGTGPATAATGPTAAPPAAGPHPAPGPPTTGPVTRPNGQRYHPRLIAGRADIDALRQLRHADIPVLLYGPPGTGKTSLVEAAFGGDLHTVAGDGDTTVGDLVGDYVPTPDGRYEFVDGPLVAAMEFGGVLFVDDATLISPKVLAALYPAMDGRRQITVKANAGRVVTAAAGFYVVAGHNPGVHGAVLTDALASRFAAHVHIGTDYDLALGLGVDPRIVRAARHLAGRADAGDIGWAPQLRELLAFKRLADVLGPQAAVANLLGVAPLEDRDVVAKAVTTAYGTSTGPLRLGRQI
jgi:hypothetical protein